MEEIELIERYFNKALTNDERSSFEERMSRDEAFRQRAEDHFLFLRSLHSYGDRMETKALLDEIHTALELPADQKKSRWVNWTTLGVAASVALICTIGTFLALRLMDDDHEANYLALRRNVDRLNKSHNQILKDIKENQPEIAPSKYSGKIGRAHV